ncbi:cytochrome P450 [Mycena pura]|uniref:Cytochrome P450 n=1 Tax=Mycena pura TaxID=153505 RepID=A0AAD6YUZ7_9AGAR|nr:cytochrome P450 [Mycena pura]
MGTLTWYLTALAAVVYYAILRKRSKSRLPLPPGPKKLPLIGNLFDIPPERQWESFQRWSREFDSDIIHLEVAGTSIVVLSSMEAAHALFEKRSSLYSDRARAPMLVELMGWDFAIGKRAHRKIFHEAFNVGAAKHFHPQERAAAHAVLRRLLQSPHDVMGQFRHMAGGLILNVAYGIKVRPFDDPYIELAEEAMHSVSVVSIPGSFLVDIIPALKYVPRWVPGAGFKRKAEHWRKAARNLLEVPSSHTGMASPSFASLSLRNLDASQDADKEAQEALIKAVAANMYSGGADTTVSALGTFVLAMLAHPDVQARAQAEIDSVVGPGNLPDFSDEASLPYVSAIVKEVLRWQNVTPIGFPHYITVEDEYAGYRIPAGSVVIGNTWSILHDEKMYPDPHSFKPERFLLDGKLNGAVRDPETAAFGFGRRMCPGRHMALGSIWITVASILATLKIDKSVDDDGEEVEPSYEYSRGLIPAPLSFKCSITPRSPQAAEAIKGVEN